MQTTGSLLLLVSVALLLVVSISGVNDFSDQATSSNDSNIVSQITHVDSVINPMYFVLGFLVLAMGAVVAISAFR